MTRHDGKQKRAKNKLGNKYSVLPYYITGDRVVFKRHYRRSPKLPAFGETIFKSKASSTNVELDHPTLGPYVVYVYDNCIKRQFVNHSPVTDEVLWQR